MLDGPARADAHGDCHDDAPVVIGAAAWCELEMSDGVAGP
jgi:hypothetical protein